MPSARTSADRHDIGPPGKELPLLLVAMAAPALFQRRSSDYLRRTAQIDPDRLRHSGVQPSDSPHSPVLACVRLRRLIPLQEVQPLYNFKVLCRSNDDYRAKRCRAELLHHHRIVTHVVQSGMAQRGRHNPRDRVLPQDEVRLAREQRPVDKEREGRRRISRARCCRIASHRMGSGLKWRCSNSFVSS